MYNNKLVASIKAGGKILREQGETVYLPFGSEYSILLKNMNTNRALVHVEIDGQDVIPGGLILDVNMEIDLERFVLNGDLSRGPKFKYIEKTAQISDHRGDKIEDGLIKVTYQYEMPKKYGGFYVDNHYPKGYYGSSPDIHLYQMKGGGATRSFSSSIDGSATLQASCFADSDDSEGMANDAGITVHGSESTQEFKYGSIGALESTKHVMVFQLKGAVGEAPVVAPVTVKRKIKCEICGELNSSKNKFCGGCGNNLTYQY